MRYQSFDTIVEQQRKDEDRRELEARLSVDLTLTLKKAQTERDAALIEIKVLRARIRELEFELAEEKWLNEPLTAVEQECMQVDDSDLIAF